MKAFDYDPQLMSTLRPDCLTEVSQEQEDSELAEIGSGLCATLTDKQSLNLLVQLDPGHCSEDVAVQTPRDFQICLMCHQRREQARPSSVPFKEFTHTHSRLIASSSGAFSDFHSSSQSNSFYIPETLEREVHDSMRILSQPLTEEPQHHCSESAPDDMHMLGFPPIPPRRNRSTTVSLDSRRYQGPVIDLATCSHEEIVRETTRLIKHVGDNIVLDYGHELHANESDRPHSTAFSIIRSVSNSFLNILGIVSPNTMSSAESLSALNSNNNNNNATSPQRRRQQRFAASRPHSEVIMSSNSLQLRRGQARMSSIHLAKTENDHDDEVFPMPSRSFIN